MTEPEITIQMNIVSDIKRIALKVKMDPRFTSMEIESQKSIALTSVAKLLEDVDTQTRYCVENGISDTDLLLGKKDQIPQIYEIEHIIEQVLNP